jgi:hypothetical protein
MSNSAYLNSIIKDLTDVLWEEHGTGAKYRTTLVGVDYFEHKYGDKLTSTTIEDTVNAVIKALKEEGLINFADFNQHNFVLTLNFNKCIHLAMEQQLLEEGLKIINCPCANVIMHFIDRLIGKFSELVDVKIEGDQCTATICVMKSDLP